MKNFILSLVLLTSLSSQAYGEFSAECFGWRIDEYPNHIIMKRWRRIQASSIEEVIQKARTCAEHRGYELYSFFYDESGEIIFTLRKK